MRALRDTFRDVEKVGKMRLRVASKRLRLLAHAVDVSAVALASYSPDPGPLLVLLVPVLNW